MKRLLMFALGALLVSTPAFASGKGNKATSPKMIRAEGTVWAVGPDALIIKRKHSAWTFAVDPSTRVMVPGATKKTAAARENHRPLDITQYVKVGDVVSIKYRDLGATRQAAHVRVRDSLPGAR